MNSIKNIVKVAQSLSIEEIQQLARTINTLYVQRMEDHRKSLDLFSLPFPEFFAACSDHHGKTSFGFLFEDWTIYNNEWTKLDRVNDPGDAVNHDGIHIEIKMSTVIHTMSGSLSVLWNRITDTTKATDYLLYAHDHRGDGTVYSFHLTKEQALKMRGSNKNNQISASISDRPNTQWARLQKYCIGVGSEPIVPEHLTSKNKSGKVAA